MTARLAVAWPIDNPDATLWQLEREARAEWDGHVAAAGLWATTDPVFEVRGVGDDLQYVGVADAILGPIELRSMR